MIIRLPRSDLEGYWYSTTIGGTVLGWFCTGLLKQMGEVKQNLRFSERTDTDTGAVLD